MIGVKRRARDAVFARRDLGLLHFIHVGMADAHFPVVMLHERSEDLAGRRELRRRELLAAEGEHVVFREVRVDFLLHLVAHRAGRDRDR